MRSAAHLLLALSISVAVLGCDHASPAISADPTPPPSDPSSAVAGRVTSVPSEEPPLVEREDLPLGKPCEFDLARPQKDFPWSRADPEWERRKGQRFVTCHFLLSPSLPVFDAEIVSTPGEDAMQSLTLHPAGDPSHATVLTRDLTLLTRRAKWTIEAIDVDFDGVKDLVMPWTWGTQGCEAFHYFVYVPRSPGGSPAHFVDSNMTQRCNPEVDPVRKLVRTSGFDGEGIVSWRWDGHDFARVPGPPVYRKK
jgi:hypothetical protein